MHRSTSPADRLIGYGRSGLRFLFASCAIAALAAIVPPPLFAAQPKDPGGAKDVAKSDRVKLKVIRVWASDEPDKTTEKDAAELKDYRKKLEGETRKKSFSIEGKVAVEDVVPGKTLQYPLVEDYRLEITPVEATGSKKGKDNLVLQMSLFKGKTEQRKLEITGNLPILYKSIRKDGRDLIVILHKIPPRR